MVRFLRTRLDRLERSMPPAEDPDAPIDLQFWRDLHNAYGEGDPDPGPPPSRREWDAMWKATLDEVYGGAPNDQADQT